MTELLHVAGWVAGYLAVGLLVAAVLAELDYLPDDVVPNIVMIWPLVWAVYGLEFTYRGLRALVRRALR